MPVDNKWSKGHVSVIDPYTLACWRLLLRMVNLRSGGALRVKWRIISWKGQGVWCEKPRSPRLYPRLSINDWWVGTCEQVLNVLIVYWCYRPPLTFSPLLHWLLWERNWVRTCRSVSHRTVDQDGSHFSWGSGSVQLYWWLRERLLCTDYVRYV
jgi:hypothetical protein